MPSGFLLCADGFVRRADPVTELWQGGSFSFFVILANAGIHILKGSEVMDSRLRGSDSKVGLTYEGRASR